MNALPLIFVLLLPLALAAPAPLPSAAPSAKPKAPPFQITAMGDQILVTAQCDSPGSLVCKEVLPPLLDALKSDVKNHVEAAYQGRQLTILPTAGPFDKEEPFQGPICDLADEAPFWPKAEKTDNHLGKSCQGGYCGFAIDLVSPALCPICGRANCPYEIERAKKRGEVWPPPVDPNAPRKLGFDSGGCGTERTWKRGAFIHEILLAWKDVSTQLQRDRMLLVGERCNQGLQDADFGTANATFAGLEDRWSTINLGRKILCDLPPGIGPSPLPDAVTSTDDPRVPRMAQCYLNAALTSLDLAVGHAALCEVFALAELRWYGRTRMLIDALPANAADDAWSACAKRKELTYGTAPYFSCLQEEYDKRILPLFEEALASQGADRRSPVELGAFNKWGTPLSNCPEKTFGCEKCGKDPIYCGTTRPFSHAQVRALIGLATDFVSAKSGLARAAELLSDGTAVPVGGPAGATASTGAGPSPGPSPSPSAKPAPGSSPQPSTPPVITFP